MQIDQLRITVKINSEYNEREKTAIKVHSTSHVAKTVLAKVLRYWGQIMKYEAGDNESLACT